MEHDRRRSGRRVCLGASAACLLLALGTPARAQDADTVPRPEVWRGGATANVASFEIDRDALLPVADVLRLIALHGESVYETDRQTARASLFFPGEGLIQGPNLACGTFGAQFPAEFKPVLDACTTFDYPLSVKADASRADASTAGGLALGKPTDAVSADAVGARAHADVDGSSTVSRMQDLRVLGLPGIGVVPLIPLEEVQLDPTVLAVGNATSQTDQRIVQGVLTVTADSKLSGVRILGGLVRIGSIHSVSTTTDDAKGTRTAQAVLEVSDVTVGGLPAQITADGLVVGSPTGGLGPLNQQLQSAMNQLVESLGLKIVALETERTLDDGTGQAAASSGGLLVEIALNADGLPSVPGPLGDIDLNGTYVGSIQLGSTGAAAGAANFAFVEPPTLDPLPPAAGGDVPVDSGGGFEATDGTAATDVSPSGEVAAPPVDVPVPTEVIRRITDPFGGRLGFLYLAFMFCVLGLCVVPRLTLPARLPASRS